MNLMERVARAAAQAEQNPTAAALWFLENAESADDLNTFIEPPHGLAHLALAAALDFELTGQPVLLRAPHGELWVCPTLGPYEALSPRATPRGLRALGISLVEQLTAEVEEPSGLTPWG